MSNPILVNNLRGDVIENRHRGAIAVCDARGRLLHAWGDVDALVYPRSAVKLLQALPLVESGAADHFELDDAELAMACSSHGAEPLHTETVQRWLERIELDEDALECGPHAPNHAPTDIPPMVTAMIETVGSCGTNPANVSAAAWPTANVTFCDSAPKLTSSAGEVIVTV